MESATLAHTFAELRIKSALKNFESIKGADDVLDRAYEKQDWQAARVRLEEIQYENQVVDSVDVPEDRKRLLRLLRITAPLYLKTLQGL